MAVAVHGLGEKGYAKMLGTRNPPMLWSEQRNTHLGLASGSQAADGSWTFNNWHPSPAAATALNLIILQLDNEHVPIFRMKKDW
jgi:hypothetical protein